MKNAWHILTMDNYIAGPFDTLRDAAWECKCQSGAPGRPRRFAPGFYEMHTPPNYEGAASTFYLCTTKMALRQGFDWMEEIGGNEKEQA